MEGLLFICLRSIVVYLFIIIAIRIFGKKEISQLSVVDLVFVLLISNSVQNAMVGPDSTLQGGLVAAASLFIINFILKQILYRDPKFNRFLQGSPVMLVHQGKIIPEHLVSQRISMDELELAMREHGVADVKEVNLAVLETDGTISILSDNYQHKTKRKRKIRKGMTAVE